jgi:hypothetical protein
MSQDVHEERGRMLVAIQVGGKRVKDEEKTP